MDRRTGFVLLPQPVEMEAVRLLEKQGIKTLLAENPDVKTVMPLMRGARAIILRTGIRITEELINRAEDLWTISRTGGGVDNIDLDSATERGIIVTSSIGVNTVSVVEHCLTLMLSLFKQIFLMDREVRRGNFRIRYEYFPREMRGKHLGIIGFGRIGSLLAKKCNSLFNMQILAYDPFLKDAIKKEHESWMHFTTLEDVFRISDIVSIHIPLNKTTLGMINDKYFRLMKSTAFLINTSRGGIIREQDLVNALKHGKIAGAGLDVFEKEPVHENNQLLTLENVILTPHSAALTAECVIRMATSAAQRVIDVFQGFIPDNIANPEVLEMERWKHLRCK